jgi:hypothetical protein
MTDRLGDKVGPRLAHLIGQYVLAARRDHAPIEARIRQTATQALIDRAGQEVADLWRPLIDHALDSHDGDVHPVMAQHLARIRSGRHQWESIAGNLQMAGTSALSATLSNVLFPGLALINLADRSTPVDAQTAAAAVVAGLASGGDGDRTAGAYGYTSEAFNIMLALAEQVPGAAQLGDMVNRGDLSEQDAMFWLQRNAIPASLRAPALAQRRLLLSPADAALAVLRGDIDQAAGNAIAASNGMTGPDFAVFVNNTGEPPAAEQLDEALRRGFIDQARYEKGIRQSRIRDEWIDVLLALRYEPMSVADAVNAVVQNYFTQDQGLQKALQNGLEAADFAVLVETAGEPLARGEMEQLYNRGLVTQAEVEQAIRESHTKDKYVTLAFDLHEKLPEPRQVVSMITHGVVTKDEGTKLLMEQGFTAQVAGFLIAEGTATKLGAHKTLTIAEIKSLYTDGIFSRAQTESLLEGMGYDAADSAYLISSWDLLAGAALTRQAVGFARTRYVAHDTDETQARVYLHSLGIGAAAVDKYITTWDLERGAAVKHLTEAQVVKAHKDGLITGQDALGRLTAAGYSTGDANILLGAPPGGPTPE